jgi:hypothetical protein
MIKPGGDFLLPISRAGLQLRNRDPPSLNSHNVYLYMKNFYDTLKYKEVYPDAKNACFLQGNPVSLLEKS